MAASVSKQYAAVVKKAAVESNLPMLIEAERASGMDLRRVRIHKGQNLLHLAVVGSFITGRLDVTRYLVEEKGFPTNSTSSEGETLIFVATDTDWMVEKGSDAVGVVPLLTYFLSHGVDPAAPDARGCTPLHNAAAGGHNEAIELLLSRDVPVDPLYHFGTPLVLAAKMGQAQAVKILLQHSADPNVVANRVHSPLVMACLGRSLECVKLLVEAGADVKFQPPGMTMLLAAVGSQSADIVNFLLEAGADPHIHDGYGRFPIMQAALHERHELVEILLPWTKPIPSLPDWSELYKEPVANAKSEGEKAFANGDYAYALYCFLRASALDPDDATMEANLSLCYLKLRQGMLAARHAQECQRLRPRWAKAWFREGDALNLLQKYGAAVTVFEEALKLDPANVEIKNKLREAKEASRKCRLTDIC